MIIRHLILFQVLYCCLSFTCIGGHAIYIVCSSLGLFFYYFFACCICIVVFHFNLVTYAGRRILYSNPYCVFEAITQAFKICGICVTCFLCKYLIILSNKNKSFETRRQKMLCFARFILDQQFCIWAFIMGIPKASFVYLFIGFCKVFTTNECLEHNLSKNFL